MSLEDKVRKDFYYSVEAKFTEFFSSVEEAAKKDKPSSDSQVEILGVKLSKANIKLNQEAENGMSKEASRLEGKAE